MKRLLCGLLAVSLCGPAAARAAEVEAFTIVIKEHRFEPGQITIPAGKKVELIVDNQDATEEEFDSSDLNREKLVGGGKKGVIYLGPLTPGAYKFYGEFNADTAEGVITVK